MSQTLLRPITCNCVLGRVLPDLEWPEMVPDLHSEGPAGAASSIALSMTWGYSPRVRAIPTSPEFELAGMNGLTGDAYNFELRHRHGLPVFLGTGNI